MESYLKSNSKKIGIVVATALLLAAVVFGDDVIAMILPNAADLQVVSCELDAQISSTPDLRWSRRL